VGLASTRWTVPIALRNGLNISIVYGVTVVMKYLVSAEVGEIMDYAEHVCHKSSPPGAQFKEVNFGGRSHPLPLCQEPQRKKLMDETTKDCS